MRVDLINWTSVGLNFQEFAQIYGNEDIITELNVTISINAINYYLLRGSEPDCLFL